MWEAVASPRAVASYKLTIGAALAAATVNAVFGLLVAWVLVRYRFPGKRIADAMIDLPFALPTAVAGIALTTVYSREGFLGQYFDAWGVPVAFTPLGIALALTFVGLPFVVRTVEPVLQDLEVEVQEAAQTLGASAWQIVRRDRAADDPAGAARGLHDGVRARARGIRIGRLHLGESADEDGDHDAADHDEAGTVRLHRRGRARGGHADVLGDAADGAQSAPDVEPAEARVSSVEHDDA